MSKGKILSRSKMLVNRAAGTIPDQENWKKIHEQEGPGESLVFTGI
jgi:hypothetical protein